MKICSILDLPRLENFALLSRLAYPLTICSLLNGGPTSTASYNLRVLALGTTDCEIEILHVCELHTELIDISFFELKTMYSIKFVSLIGHVDKLMESTRRNLPKNMNKQPVTRGYHKQHYLKA